MKKVIIIPARFSSTRLPGKPLLDLDGKPMIVRVCEAASAAPCDQIVVATDDARIQAIVREHGFQAIMTRTDHVSGTDRLQEAAQILDLAADDLIINLQGDEPLMPADNLNQVAELLIQHPQASVATLYELIPVGQGRDNPNMVKLVQAEQDAVLYFSRAAIPYDRDGLAGPNDSLKRHVGLYAYRKSALDQFVSYSEGQLERLEKLEQLRFMENGHRIVAQRSLRPIPVGVDTAEDLEQVRVAFLNRRA